MPYVPLRTIRIDDNDDDDRPLIFSTFSKLEHDISFRFKLISLSSLSSSTFHS